MYGLKLVKTIDVGKKHGVDCYRDEETGQHYYHPWYRRSVGGTSYYYTTADNWQRATYDTYHDAHNHIARSVRNPHLLLPGKAKAISRQHPWLARHLLSIKEQQ